MNFKDFISCISKSLYKQSFSINAFSLSGSGKSTFVRTALSTEFYCSLTISDFADTETLFAVIRNYLNDLLTRDSNESFTRFAVIKSIDDLHLFLDDFTAEISICKPTFVVDEITDQNKLIDQLPLFSAIIEMFNYFNIPVILVSNFNILISAISLTVDFSSFVAYHIPVVNKRNLIESLLLHKSVDPTSFKKLSNCYDELSKCVSSVELKKHFLEHEVERLNEGSSPEEDRKRMQAKIKGQFLWNVATNDFFENYLGRKLKRNVKLDAKIAADCSFPCEPHSLPGRLQCYHVLQKENEQTERDNGEVQGRNSKGVDLF